MSATKSNRAGRTSTKPSLENWRSWPAKAKEELLQHLRSKKDPMSSLGPLHPRQQEFLSLKCEEALYGGAAGGGKTEALLRWLAEGVHIPKYSALFLRRTFAQLRKSTDSPIERSHALYRPLGGKYTSTDHTWRWPNGAMIEFGHMNHEEDMYDYQGPAYHRVAYDELTQFTESMYLYLFSRMRMHVDFPIALGMRAGSNPGGEGHEWVRRRFVTKEAEQELRDLDLNQPSPPGMVYWKEGRAFIPARLIDNPTLNREDYTARMKSTLPPVLLARLLNGDWSVVENALIREEWFRYYTFRRGMYYVENGSGEAVSHVEQVRTRRVMTVDPAGTSADMAREKKGKPPAWSVGGQWDMATGPTGQKWKILVNVWRHRLGFTELCNKILADYRQFKPCKVLIENEKIGVAVQDSLKKKGVPITLCRTGGKDKVVRAVPLMKAFEKGEVFFPRGNTTWLPVMLGEILAWEGDPNQASDHIDMAAYAAQHSDSGTGSWGGVIKR